MAIASASTICRPAESGELIPVSDWNSGVSAYQHHPEATLVLKHFEEHLIRLLMTQGLLQLSLFGRDQMVRRHPTQFTEVIHADLELNRSAGEVDKFGCHLIGTTESISPSERPMATPDIWTKSRVVRRKSLIA